MNRLNKEKSPYLLQHADNPVDWYPWGEEAFGEAKKQDKPVFLSVGYSTCHWCHVMAHESFEDERIAKLINQYFIPVKVDREERPDIDQIYMAAVQAIAGQGGWPLTVILTPDKVPFFGGTYFPPEARWGNPGLIDLIHSIGHVWQQDRLKINESAQQLADFLRKKSERLDSGAQLHGQISETAFNQFTQNFDSQNGGFSHAPKFPSAHNVSFLLRYGHQTPSDKALQMAFLTLHKMAQGGIYDHLGGGFHRYATDHLWQVPHFEKMLYDQATITRSYLEAYQITKDKSLSQIVQETFNYVIRDLSGKEGAFYSAEDADSYDPDEKNPVHKKEGAYYLWRYEEVEEVLDKSEADIFRYCYGFKKEGNAHVDPHNEFSGKNIIFQVKSFQEAAVHFSISEDKVVGLLKGAKEKLLKKRYLRSKPYLDDKILTDWNGLMISSLAYGSSVLQDPVYLDAARKAADFILDKLVTKDGRLLHRYRDGDASIDAMIDDYAFFIYGLLDLYEASFEIKYLKSALRLAEIMAELFWDKERGGFFYTAETSEKLLFRQKEIYDGAVPSGNSIAAYNCLRLHHFTLKQEWKDKAALSFDFFAPDILKWPSAYTQMLMAYDFYLKPVKQIVISASEHSLDVNRSLALIHKEYAPNKIVILKTHKNSVELSSMIPFIAEQVLINGKTAFYVCENHTCQLPTDDLGQLQELLLTSTSFKETK